MLDYEGRTRTGTTPDSAATTPTSGTERSGLRGLGYAEGRAALSPTTAAPPPPPAGAFQVTVRAGDTLSGLAARHLGDASAWRILWDANRATIPNPNLIRVGQVLTVPGRGRAPEPPRTNPTPPAAAPAPGGDTTAVYVVKPLDTLSYIAEKVLGSAGRWREIWELNRDRIPNPSVIHPGQELRVPRTTSQPSRPPETPRPADPNGRAVGRTPTERVMAKLYNEKGPFIAQQAANLGIEPAVAAAVLVAESSGTGYGENGQLKIRFETHIFEDYTNKTVSNSHRNQAAEYDAFERAKAIDETAAYKSISMGAAQIMGFNAESVGYGNAKEMFEAFQASETKQLMGLFEFVRVRPVLVKAARDKDWETFARHYNGPGYRRYAYHIKLATYYDAYRSVTANL